MREDLHIIVSIEDQAALMESLLDEPALNPPPGVVANFADPGGSQTIGYGIIIATSIISTIAVLARLMSSIALKRFLIEDLLMVAALVGILQSEKNMRAERCPRAFSPEINTLPTTSPSIQVFGHTSGIFRTNFLSTSYM